MAFVPTRKTKTLPKRKTKLVEDAKPVWDDSITDLQAYRASSEEMSRRKQVTKPSELTRQQLKSKISAGDARFANSQVLRDILFANRNIDDILADSDKTMSLVEDLFGENPGKYSGISSITPAPNFQRLPVHTDEVHANSLSSNYSDSEGSESYLDQRSRFQSDAKSSGSNFRAEMNLDHYKALLRSTEDELRMLNNGVVKAASSLGAGSQLQNQDSMINMPSSSVGLTNRSDPQSLLSQASNSSMSIPNNGGEMRLILSAIEDLRSAVMSNSSMSQNQSQSTIQNARSSSDSPVMNESQTNSQDRQLANLRNLYPLIQKANGSGSNLNKKDNEVASTITEASQTVQSTSSANEINFNNLKTFDQLVSTVKSLSDEQKLLKGKIIEKDAYTRTLEAKIEKQNATIRALAEDIIQLQGVMAHWAEVQNHN